MYCVQVMTTFQTLMDYMKEYDTETGAYRPQSIYSVYVGDGNFVFYAWLPEVCRVRLYNWIRYKRNNGVMTTAPSLS